MKYVFQQNRWKEDCLSMCWRTYFCQISNVKRRKLILTPTVCCSAHDRLLFGVIQKFTKTLLRWYDRCSSKVLESIYGFVSLIHHIFLFLLAGSTKSLFHRQNTIFKHFVFYEQTQIRSNGIII